MCPESRTVIGISHTHLVLCIAASDSLPRCDDTWPGGPDPTVIDSTHASPSDLLAQPDAVAVADLPVLLQVLRVRDAPGAPVRPSHGKVIEILDGAAKRQVKELLVLTGEKPEVNPGVAARLAEYGHEDFTSYVVWTCERALERGLLPHTNLGVLSREDLARLREVTASQGLMLESVSERLMETVHAGSPTKHPARRLETIRAAGELKIPFTSGILVGIGESEQERMESLEALAAVHAEHGHIQEVILQNFVPHQRYYGEEPAEIADQAAAEYWRTGVADSRPELRFPEWACPVSDRGHEAADRGDAPADARRRHPDAAEPRRLVGRARGGRRDRPRRAERQRRPHLARAPVSLAAPGAQGAAARRSSRRPSACACTRSTSTPSGSRRACST